MHGHTPRPRHVANKVCSFPPSISPHSGSRDMCTNLLHVIEKTLPSLPYSEDYLELLDDINNKDITFDDIKNPQTPMDEHHARVVLEGVTIKRENQTLKENIISPELSAHHITLHA